VILRLTNGALQQPCRIVEDMLGRLSKFMIPPDFVVMDIEENKESSFDYWKTIRMVIDGQWKVENASPR